MEITTVKEKNAKKAKMSKWEIFWTVIESIMGFAGLFLLVLGIIGDNLQILSSDNWILQANLSSKSSTGLTYREWGAILIVAAALLAALTLNHFAKKTDMDEERENRRAQRLQILSASAEADRKAEQERTVEVSSEPAKEEEKLAEPTQEDKPE